MYNDFSKNRIEVSSKNLPELLFLLRQLEKPLILTTEGKGIAAIVPYTDLYSINMDRG